jgi:arylsulfatase A-like enzyme
MLTRRDLIKTACAAEACSAARGAAPEARRPNLVFIFSDQHSSDMLGCYGNRQVLTPNLDRLASEGVRFGHCISNTPVCSPYRAILMSGQHPLYNGVFCNDVSILHNARHFAEVLRDSGYRTGYVGKWHLFGGDRNRPIPSGPDRLGFDELFLSDNCSLKFGPKDSYYWNAEGQKTLYNEWQPYGQARQAVEFLEAQSADRPFALFVSVHPPHNFGPEHYKTEPELMAQYDPAAIRLRPNVKDTPEIREWYRGHMAMITGVDQAFGRVLDKLREKKLDNNTIVVFTADHGDLLRSHGRPWPKSFPEAESCRVPLLVRWPKHLSAGRTSDLLIGTLDLMPTLLSLMGAAVPSTCQGRNLSRAVLDGDSHAVESVPLFYFEPCWRGVYTHRYTYSFGEPGQTLSWDVLYDRERDPSEQKNLFGVADQRGLQRKMDDLTRSWMRKFDDDFAPTSELMRVCFHTQTELPVVKFSKDGRIPGRPIDLLKKSAQ